MTTCFITRHPGAIDWARAEKLLPAETQIAASYDPEQTQPGDLIIGTLPAQVAARICERGGRYQHLSLDLSEAMRGKELSQEEMQACHARLEEFHIQRSQVRHLDSTSGESIHIVLATGENLPNLIPALAPALKASQVFILASQTMQARAELLKHGLQRAGLAEHRCQIVKGCPDHDLAQILAWATTQAQQIAAQAPGARLILNLTGGNKLMTIGFLQAFRPYAETIYCDTEAARVDYFHPLGKAPEKLPVNLLSIAPYLAVQGYKLRENSPDIQGIQARSQLTRQLAEQAPRCEHLIGQLNNAAYQYREAHLARATLSMPKQQPEQTLIDLMCGLGLLKPTAQQLAIASDTAATYLGGGWLEEWCWLIGKKLEQGEPGKRLSSARWGINLMIDPWDQLPIPGRTQHPLNELDAVFIHRNRMLLIECKSGQQISERGESQGILNKLETLGKHVGGRLDTKWLLSARSIDRNTQAKQRAEKYGIKIIRPDELSQLKTTIYRWMTQ